MRKFVKIGAKVVGEGYPSFFIAEIGLNHNGEVAIAKKLIDIAVTSGADAVKFQKRDIDGMLTKEAQDKPYGGAHSFGKTYGEHRMRLELTEKDFFALKKYCDSRKIIFLSSGWDRKSIDFLDKLGVDAMKVASADLTNIPFLEYVARKNKPVILSTGMAEMKEVKKAFSAINRINKRVILLQCTSTYPCRFEDVNLNVLRTYKEKFTPLVGYSGHEQGIAVTLCAVVMGAVMVERHFTLDRSLKGPDHSASLEPQGLYKLIRDIRIYEKSLGSYKKECLEVEKPIREKLSKSLVSTCKIRAGSVIKKGMLTEKSPGVGIPPYMSRRIIGKRASITIEKDKIITKDMIKC